MFFVFCFHLCSCCWLIVGPNGATCNQCQANNWCAGGTTETPCPTNSASPVQSTSASACVCNAGYYGALLLSAIVCLFFSFLFILTHAHAPIQARRVPSVPRITGALVGLTTTSALLTPLHPLAAQRPRSVCAIRAITVRPPLLCWFVLVLSEFGCRSERRNVHALPSQLILHWWQQHRFVCTGQLFPSWQLSIHTVRMPCEHLWASWRPMHQYVFALLCSCSLSKFFFVCLTCIVCADCPANTTAPAGSPVASDCVCKPATYGPAGGPCSGLFVFP